MKRSECTSSSAYTQDAYYNENDPFAAQWLRNLIGAGLISPGTVDERDIRDVRPSDVRGFARAHFFTGIAGWDLALQLAGWPSDRPVWTGSCPCQPFSAAGRRAGLDDSRHLWPAWFELIRQCRPPIVLGEQVEAAVRLGWLDAVFADLEGEGYACGAAVLGAHSVGAPHIRQRLWFVAYASGTANQHLAGSLSSSQGPCCGWGDHGPWSGGEAVGLADTANARHGWSEDAGADRGNPCALQGRGQRLAGLLELERGGAAFRVGDASAPGLPDLECQELPGSRRRSEGRAAEQPGRAPWSDLVWLPCRDGKARPTQPGLQPLAHGATARVGRLRAAGNAIVPQVAAEFIRACLDVAPAARRRSVPVIGDLFL